MKRGTARELIDRKHKQRRLFILEALLWLEFSLSLANISKQMDRKYAFHSPSGKGIEKLVGGYTT